MRKLYTLLFLTLLFPLALLAEKWTPETLPMVHLQDARRYVCNPDGVLSDATVSHTDQILSNLERDKGIESVVVVVKQLAGDDPYQFGMDLGRKYGVGSKKQRTGLIVILAVEDRSYQILTGNGLEGTLPDAICRRIQNRVMVPELKEMHWDAAIYNTIVSLDKYIRDDGTLKAEIEEEEATDEIVGLIIALVFGGVFIFIVISSHNKRKCPKCKQAQMRVVKQQRVRMNNSYEWYIRTTMRCPRCGHEHVTLQKEDDIDSGGGITPPFFMGGGGSFGGGGGFSGGSFGGGSFGGGGSGGRF